MKISLSKRIVSFVLCLTVLLAGFAYKPQKTEALALSASVIASVATIMTACGVSFWAGSQTDAIDFLGSKIDSYLGSLETVPQSYEDWLGIDAASQLFDVTASGTMRFTSGVANKILGFVRSFFDQEGIETGGSAVGNGTVVNINSSIYNPYEVSFNGGGTINVVSASELQIYVNIMDKTDYRDVAIQAIIPCNAGEHITVSYNEGDISDSLINKGMLTFCYDADASISTSDVDTLGLVNANRSRTLTPTNDYFVLRYIVASMFQSSTGRSGTIKLHLSVDDLETADTALVTPSIVDIPSDVGDNDIFDVAPSVSLSQGMSVDDASSAIFDGVTSADGLTSSGEAVEPPSVDLSGILEILGGILNAILAIPEHIAALPSAIASAFSSLLTSIESVLDSIEDWVASIAQTVIGIPQAIGQAASDVITGIGIAISTALYSAFVPSEAAIDAFVVTLAENFDNHFSILSYPFSLLGKFILEVVDAPGDHTLVWPDIFEPFSGQRLIAAGSYNLDDALDNQNFRTAYDTYMTVIKGYIAFQFVAYLYAWFCDVFRMRNDDFDNPIFTQEPIDEGDDEPDDWDGYDSFFET